jgi:hypothetical protein
MKVKEMTTRVTLKETIARMISTISRKMMAQMYSDQTIRYHTCSVFLSLLVAGSSALYLRSKSSSGTLLHRTSTDTYIQDILETPREAVTSQCVEFATVLVRHTRRSVSINVPSEPYIYVT